MLVSVYCINQGTPSQYYGLKNAEENTALSHVPNNWKTKAGAKRWAQRNGFTVKEKKPKGRLEKATEYSPSTKRKTPTPRTKRKTPNTRKKINPMCENCGEFGGECKGTTEMAYTGCVYRTIKK